MKNYIFLLIAGVLLMSCNKQEFENQITQLEAEKAEMLEAIESKDTEIISFMTAFAKIEENLSEIREREMNIQVARHENELSSEALEAKIGEDIQVISQLLQENRKKLESLSAKLAVAKSDNSKLNRLMSQLKVDLTKQIEERENEISILKDQLAHMKIEIQELHYTLTDLRKVGLAQDSVIHAQIEEMNTAYYVVGSSKELEKEQVISREGGILGLGKTEKLSSNFKADKFTKIDIRQRLSIPIEAEELELVTTHPDNAYKIEKDKSHHTIKLVISDPAAFWESSKYLVLVTK